MIISEGRTFHWQCSKFFESAFGEVMVVVEMVVDE